ncbi:Hypothetical protein PP7435_CHR4-1884 [Komagataella phaffii CBS 7435]|uniref:Uncharacterized protein n=1 Tax=Komagataella phaffii (strain ATCC 76273 / CBS 7435 / CECT 11047 / NRRL Y-11430 / Wegner 21-1) TaxID=981350 RepID=A0A1G4KQZ5_KOMPC|nr:Hypothetical protein BQ9382_C4-4532 [Komagataella phaffii CBS 7435]SCV12426.1 Hypothetical protein PP7435_CHR4-1884 [Komagataella phaffii CBS 7435]
MEVNPLQIVQLRNNIFKLLFAFAEKKLPYLGSIQRKTSMPDLPWQ